MSGVLSVTAGTKRGALGRRHAGLGARRIWPGVLILVAVQMVFDLGQSIGRIGGYADPQLIGTAWLIIIVANLAVVVVHRALGDHLPNWMFGLFVAALGVALLLDLAATWDRPDVGYAISAGMSATLSLLIALPTRPELEVMLAALSFTFIAALAMAFGGGFELMTMQGSIFMLCQMSLTVVVGTVAMAGFRGMVRRDIEWTLSRGTLLAPRFTIGIDQSEQLARLDLAAESLLAAVAEGRVHLPLNDEIARRAGTLATELRMHLLDSRSKTWLDLAIEESELLAAAVRVEDEFNGAGLLGPRQRGALLSALWLLAEQHPTRRGAPSATLVAFDRPVQVSAASAALAVPIRIRLGSSGGSGFEPGIWEHFAQVGNYREVNEPGAFGVEISAVVPVAGPRTSVAR